MGGGASSERLDRRIDAYRRTLDVGVSVVLVVLTLPIVIVAAVGSAIVLGAWPFFVQSRVGLGGEPFRFFKVRTLPRSVPGYVDKHHLDLDAIPRFCRLLRKLHLDELPQLLLVLRGKMSLVGPRPEMAGLHDHLAPDFADLRTSVRPGCTGLWQVSAACTDLIGVAPEYDRAYLAERTLRLDLWVLGRTVLKMVGIGRSVTLADIPAWIGRRDRTTVIDLTDATQGEAALGRPAEAGLRLPAAAGR